MPNKKSRGSLGVTAMHSERLGSGLFSTTLYRMAMRLPPEPRKKKEPKVDGRTLAGQAVLSDDAVRAIRRAYEEDGKSFKEIAADTGLAYGRVYRLCTYRDRCGVV